MRLCCQIIALLNRLLWPHADDMTIIRALFFSSSTEGLLLCSGSISYFLCEDVQLGKTQLHIRAEDSGFEINSVRFHFASLKYSSDVFTHLYPNLYKTPYLTQQVPQSRQILKEQITSFFFQKNQQHVKKLTGKRFYCQSETHLLQLKQRPVNSDLTEARTTPSLECEADLRPRRLNPELNSSWGANHHREAALDPLPKTKESKCESEPQRGGAERTLSASASGCSRGWAQRAARWIRAQKTTASERNHNSVAITNSLI